MNVRNNKPEIISCLVLDPPSPLTEESEKILTACNELVNFINSFRYCHDAGLLKSGKRSAEDIEQREVFVAQLAEEDYQNELENRLESNAEHLSERKNQLHDLISGFSAYACFAHLTACELAVVGIALEKLSLLLEVYRAAYQFEEAKPIIAEKYTESIQLQAIIYACMKMHIAVFENNLESEKDNGETPPNDILLNLKSRLSFLIGDGNLKALPDLYPDKTLLMAIPDLPFGEDKNVNAARNYFELFIEAYENRKPLTKISNAVISNTKWVVGRCWDGTKWVATTTLYAPVWVVSTAMSAAVSVFPYRQNFDTRLPSESDSADKAGNHLPQSLEDKQLYVEKMMEEARHFLDIAQSMQQSHLVNNQEDENIWAFKTKLTEVIEKLNEELEDCMTSCFSFFMSSVIELKEKKLNALRVLMTAESMQDLQEKAAVLRASEDGDDIMRGYWSRTRKIFDEILQDQETAVSPGLNSRSFQHSRRPAVQ